MISLLLILTIVFAIAYVGTWGVMQGIAGWYVTLAKPSFTPPSWVFSIVWSVLYFLSGLALWQVYSEPPSRARSLGITLFAVQLVLNVLWSWIFFAFHRLDLAFYEILALVLAIAGTILVFFRVRASAAWLLIPYLAWTIFATLLTFSIWQLNRSGPVVVPEVEPVLPMRENTP